MADWDEQQDRLFEQAASDDPEVALTATLKLQPPKPPKLTLDGEIRHHEAIVVGHERTLTRLRTVQLTTLAAIEERKTLDAKQRLSWLTELRDRRAADGGGHGTTMAKGSPGSSP